jgi:arsenate reductase
LDRPPHDAVRAKEEAYAASGLSLESDLAAVCEAIVAEPILLERPIVVKGAKAVIGRPPEDVLKLL